jgi:hypothetical protein
MRMNANVKAVLDLLEKAASADAATAAELRGETNPLCRDVVQRADARADMARAVAAALRGDLVALGIYARQGG